MFVLLYWINVLFISAPENKMFQLFCLRASRLCIDDIQAFFTQTKAL